MEKNTVADVEAVTLLQRSMLAHLEAQACADEANVEILHFKGPFAVSDFPDRIGTHTDADVLVAAGGIPKLVKVLQERGWHIYYPNEDGLEGHGQVLIHPTRGCTIDLHHYFPGMRSQWEHNFAAMYEKRINWPVRSYPRLDVVNRIDHAILLLLDTFADRIGSEVLRSRRNTVLWAALSEDEKTLLCDRAAQVNVQDILCPDNENGRSGRRRLLMELQHSPGFQGAAVWLQRLHDSESLARKGKVLWLALITVPHTDSQGSYPARLVRHWYRGIRQVARIVFQHGTSLFRRPQRIPPEEVDDNTQVCKANNSDSDQHNDEASMPQVDDVNEPIASMRNEGQHKGQLSSQHLWFIDNNNLGAAIDLGTGKTLRLEGPAATLWEELSVADTIDHAITATLGHYANPPAEAEQQLREIVNILAELGALRSR